MHARGKPLAESVSLSDLAARTAGFSGASLMNVLNEAAIVAARRNRTSIGYGEVDYAIDRIVLGVVIIMSRGCCSLSVCVCVCDMLIFL